MKPLKCRLSVSPSVRNEPIPAILFWSVFVHIGVFCVNVEAWKNSKVFLKKQFCNAEWWLHHFGKAQLHLLSTTTFYFLLGEATSVTHFLTLLCNSQLFQKHKLEWAAECQQSKKAIKPRVEWCTLLAYCDSCCWLHLLEPLGKRKKLQLPSKASGGRL